MNSASSMHSLLRRQLKRHASHWGETPEDITSLINAIDVAYKQFDEDRAMLERSMELSSSELLEANSAMRAILKSFPDIIFWLGIDGTIINWQSSADKGAHGHLSDFIGKRIQDTPNTETSRIITNALRRVNETGKVDGVEYCLDHDGVSSYYEMRLCPISGDKILAVIRDISDKKTTEFEKGILQEQLGNARKMEAIGRLAGGIAHDFNNILFSIIGFSQLVARKMDKSSLEYSNVQEVIKAGVRGKELVEQILIFSRWRERQKVPIKVQKIAEDVLGLLAHTVPKDVSVVRSIDSDAKTIEGDPAQIHQTIMNICTNAMQAMYGQGGELRISLSNVITELPRWAIGKDKELPPGEYVSIKISDTGYGIPPEVMDRIFEPFFTTKEIGQGTGLGLAAVHGIVDGHNGGIFIDTVVGNGTTFELMFPVKEFPADSQEDISDELVRGVATIMVVDDEQTLASLLSQMLSSLGYRVVAFTDSLEAWDDFQIHSNEYSLVITDQTMPRLKGIDLANKIFAHAPNVPVMLVTGFSEDITPQTAVEAGCFKCLVKPLQVEVLAKYVGDAVRHYEKCANSAVSVL